MQNLIEFIKHQSRPLQPLPTGETFRITGRNGSHGTIQAILFDIYGTLFISASGDIGVSENKPGIHRELQIIVDRYHVDIPGRELPGLFLSEVRKEHQRLREDGIEYPEIRVEEIWAQILQKDPEADRNFIEAFALSYEIAVNPVYPMPGLSGVIQSIRSRGIVLGIISNAQFFTPLLFPAFLGTSAGGLGFTPSLCFYSYEFRQGKPGSSMYEKSAETLRAMGIEPEHTLFVGNDMRNDILPAISLGFQTALFAGDKRSLRWREEMPEYGTITPDYILSGLEDVVSLIQESLSSVSN